MNWESELEKLKCGTNWAPILRCGAWWCDVVPTNSDEDDGSEESRMILMIDDMINIIYDEDEKVGRTAVMC